MGEAPTAPTAPNVPHQVFEKYLADLATANVQPDLIARLRKTLVDEGSFTERALRAAVFSEDAPTT